MTAKIPHAGAVERLARRAPGPPRAAPPAERPAPPPGREQTQPLWSNVGLGPVDGSFIRSSVLPGVYHMGPNGSTYYERNAEGRMVPAQVDEYAGLEQAIARERARADRDDR